MIRKSVLSGRKLWIQSIVALLVVMPSVVASQEKTILVPSEGLTCVVNNTHNYLSGDESVILIFLHKCPDANISKEDISSLAVALTPRPSDEGDATKPQSVISLKRSQLECLGNKKSDILSSMKDTDIVNLLSILSTYC